ncbi:hypothetical protein GCM10007071_28810 [Marinobacter zhanjiangensis]|uniref:Type IV pilin Tt1218-like domain-containing protein n=2 Tax=Marinobacter zhanjiangensis TaxID=578215 RepID=A0ABQ3B5T3_9GAMM|nr:hypothetical protein GCM10007071_28810 [Marinobacter zhanjiangensis]
MNKCCSGIQGKVPDMSHRHAGFGLIEVLISLLILAVGLLGLGSLQSTGLTMTSEARNRSQAIFLADDIFERARANRSNLAAYQVDALNDPDCNENFSIDNAGVAADDLAEWQNSLACLLPNGTGSVNVADSTVTVQVTWDANSGNDDDGSLTMAAEI